MWIAKDNIVRKGRGWSAVIAVTSIVIVVIASFFLTRMFRANPLQGSWESEKSGMILEISGNNYMTVGIPDIQGEDGEPVRMDYTLDKEGKIVTIRANRESIEEAKERVSGQDAAEELDRAVNAFATAYDYSVDREKLTLTEREYGEQIVFMRKK